MDYNRLQWTVMDSDDRKGRPMPESPVYSLAEAAEMLGVHYETAARWVRTGKLEGVKLSRRKVVVPKEKLDAFIAGDTLRSGPNKTLEAGSPGRWMALVRTLTPAEAKALRHSAQVFEKVDEED
jgi:excisionase family DNA binding protein